MIAKHPFRTLQRGFSLVELAVVLLIIGLALGAGIAVLNIKVAQARVDTTKARIEGVRIAMTAYASQNYRLPCPAAPGLVVGVAGYNAEQSTTTGVITTCLSTNGVTNNIGGAGPSLGASRGTVPCSTLGLTEEACTDGWGSRLTYFVDNRAVNLNKSTVGGMRGILTVHKIAPPAVATPVAGAAPTGNQINACGTVAADKSCNLEAVAIVLSHGANRGGGFPPTSATLFPTANISAYELENTDNNLQLLQNDYVESGINSFDDVVTPIVPRDLVANLSQSGTIKQPAAFMAERFELVKHALLQNAFANAIPSGATRTLVLAAESGAATAFGFTATNIPAPCALPVTTQQLPSAATLPALHAAGGFVTDAWNNPIRYRRVVNTIGNNATCSVPFVLLSQGPDGVPSADDVLYYVTFADVSTFVTKYGGW